MLENRKKKKKIKKSVFQLNTNFLVKFKLKFIQFKFDLFKSIIGPITQFNYIFGWEYNLVQVIKQT